MILLCHPGYFTSDEKFNISKDKVMVISMAAQELGKLL